MAYDALQDYPRAIADYDHAIQVDPKLAAAYYNRGTVYADLQDYPHAIIDYDSAIQLDPNFAYAYYNRGLAYLWLKDLRWARTDYLHSTELGVSDVNAPWMAEWAGMDKERAGVEIAEMLEQIATIDPKNYVAYVSRGVSLGLRGKLAEGLAELEQAIPMEPEEPDAYFWKGMICAYLGRNSAAIEAIEKALEVDLPPILLTPLYWLERDRPDFFREYARSLLEKYDI